MTTITYRCGHKQVYDVPTLPVRAAVRELQESLCPDCTVKAHEVYEFKIGAPIPKPTAHEIELEDAEMLARGPNHMPPPHLFRTRS